MKCWVCNHELIWGGDHDLEDVVDDHTIITNLSCPECDAFVEVYHGKDIPMSRSRMMNHVTYLRDEIKHLETLIQPHDTGHIHTTIGVLEERVKEIDKQLKEDDE